MCSLALIGFVGTSAAASAVNPFPIDRLVGEEASLHRLVETPVDCPAAPEPVVSLATESRYDPSDKRAIEIKEVRSEAYRRAIKPVRSFIKSVVSSANRSVEKPIARQVWAECALSLLSTWATAGALTDLQTNTARLHRGAQVAALSLATLQIRDAVAKDPRLPEVIVWLKGLADASRAYADSRPKATSSNANHRYWTGLGAAAAGVVARDESLVLWGIESARIGLRQVTDDGFLPLELARERRARDYHLYAVAPLILIAEIAALRGTDLYTEHDGALLRLAHAVILALHDPSDMSAAAGDTQLPFPSEADLPPKNRLAWLEPYAARTGDPDAMALLEELRPLSFTALGGNVTMLFSRGLADAP